MMEPAVVTGIGLALPGVTAPADLLGEPPAGVTAVDPVALLGHRRGLRYKDRATQLALAAAQGALVDAGLWADGALTVPGGTVGVVGSSNLGNLDTVCTVAAAIGTGTVAAISPMDLPNASSNVVASWVAIRFGLRGPNLMVTNGLTAGLDALHWAAVLVGAGRAERAVVVGVEVANEVTARFTEAAVLDGGAAVVVESAAAARGRDRPGLSTIEGYARDRDLSAALRGAGAETAGTPAVWFGSGRREEPVDGTPLAGVRRVDVTERFGHASGALGVVQCVTALGWLAGTAEGTVLAATDADGTAVLRLGGTR